MYNKGEKENIARWIEGKLLTTFLFGFGSKRKYVKIKLKGKRNIERKRE